MNRLIVLLAVVLGGAGFLGMVKLMYDMNGHMARMTEQVGAMTTDVHAMRESMERMTVTLQQGGRQMNQIMNPMQMLPGANSGGATPPGP